MVTNDRGGKRPCPSRLSESLLRLERTVQSVRSRGSESQGQFDQWQARWESRRVQIVEHLALIDSHLQELVQQRDGAPQLSVHAE